MTFLEFLAGMWIAGKALEKASEPKKRRREQDTVWGLITFCLLLPIILWMFSRPAFVISAVFIYGAAIFLIALAIYNGVKHRRELQAKGLDPEVVKADQKALRDEYRFKQDKQCPDCGNMCMRASQICVKCSYRFSRR